MLTPRQFQFLILILVMIWSAGCSKEARKNSHLARANRYFEAEQYKEAEVEYRNVLQLAPLNPVALGQLGIMYYDQGMLSQAYAYLQKAAGLEPENVDVQLKLGSTYLSIGKFKEAREAAMGILGKQPGHEKALLLLADASHAPEELQETQQLIEKLRQQNGDRAGYHQALGTLYLQQQDLTRAESEFRKALDLDPKSSAAHFALGNLYWNISAMHLAFDNPNWVRYDLTQADQAFQTAIELAPLRSAERLRYIDFKLQNGAATEGKMALEEITQKAPDYLPAWVRLMKIAFAERRYEDCAALVQNILKRDPANYEALLQSGNLKLAQGDAASAVTEFEHLNTVYNRVPQVQYRLALAYLQNGDAADAISTLNQAIALNPNFDEAVLLLAQLNIRAGDFAAAITSLTQFVEQRPQTPKAHLLLAQAYLNQKNNDQALAVYRRMMELFPEDPQVPLLIGMVLVQKNERTDARKEFEKSLEISPDYAPALEQLVDLDLSEGQFATAMDRVKKQIEKSPKLAQPWVLQAKIYIAQRDMTKAEAALLRAIDLDPNFQTAYLMLAQIYVASNKHQQAIEKLTALVAKTNSVAALMQIGIMQNELKHFEAARDAYEQLLVLNPKFGPALNNLACLYSEHLGQLDKAYEMATRARGLLPDDPSTADTLGWIFFKKADYDRALALLSESAEKLSADPEIQYHLGMVHYMRGEEEPARVGLQRAAEASKDFPDKEEARRRLALLKIDVKMTNPTDLAELEKQLREEPNDPVALCRLAAIQERDGAVEKAVQNYESALKQNPRNAQVMLKLAQLYSGFLNDPQKALGLAEGAHKLAPDDPSISQTLGLLVFQASDYQRALSLLEAAERQLSNKPELMHDLAWSYYSVGRLAEAEAMMQRALQSGISLAKLDDARRFLAMIAAAKSSAEAQAAFPQAQNILNADPKYVPAVMVSALFQEQQGDYQEAKQLYEKALAVYPLLAPATRQLAILYAQRLGDDQKAYEFAVRAREAFPEDAELAKTLGILDYRRGDYAWSALLLRESVRKRNDDAELLYYLGMADYRLKEWQESKDALQRSLALNVPTKLADEAKRLLAELK
jgi:tetratricopeptide (TPR) repeat protein